MRYGFRIYTLLLCLNIVSLSGNELKTRSITINNYSIFYNLGGEKEPYFLLLSGLGVDRMTFFSLALLIAKEYGYKVLLPDIPGQGKTKRDKNISYTIEFLADFFYQFLKELGVTKAVVVGNSMGGHIATVMALKYPEKIHTLVLINPAGIVFDGQKPYQMLPESILYDRRNRISITDFEWNNKIRKDIQSCQYYILNDRLKYISVTTFLFWGAYDTNIPYSYSSVWASEIPDVLFFVIKGGHLLQKEKPEDILRIFFKYWKE